MHRGLRAAGILVFVAAMVAGVASVIGFARDLDRSVARSDFVVFYTAGKIASRGDIDGLYDVDTVQEEQVRAGSERDKPAPFPYPATVAFVFVPLTAIPLTTAFALFFAANLLVLGVTGYLLWRACAPAPVPIRMAVIGFTAVNYATLMVFFHGHMDLILCAALLAAYVSGWDAGVFPLVLKPQMLPGVGLLWLQERRLLPLLALLATGAAVFLWPLALAPASISSLLELHWNVVSGRSGGYDDSFVWSTWGSPLLAVPFLLIQILIVIETVRLWSAPSLPPHLKWILVFMLPTLVTPHGPSHVILAGAWAILASREGSLELHMAIGVLAMPVALISYVIPIAFPVLVAAFWMVRAFVLRAAAEAAALESYQTAMSEEERDIPAARVPVAAPS